MYLSRMVSALGKSAATMRGKAMPARSPVATMTLARKRERFILVTSVGYFFCFSIQVTAAPSTGSWPSSNWWRVSLTSSSCRANLTSRPRTPRRVADRPATGLEDLDQLRLPNSAGRDREDQVGKFVFIKRRLPVIHQQERNRSEEHTS